MSHAVEVPVMDSMGLNPLSSLLAGRNAMKPSEAISMGVMGKVMKALKTLSDENKELRREIRSMRESQAVSLRTKVVPSRSESQDMKGFVDPKRKMGWMPVD